jgi:putative (di)nucleoside polyphosphate hydrolase
VTTASVDLDRYRPNVGLALFHKTGLVFLGRRVGQQSAYNWQMPQGGVDPGETPREAALRELEEEVGLEASMVEILDETSDWLTYDFPADVPARGGLGRYVGQKQKWFAMRFLGKDSDVRLDLHKPEFGQWRWARLDEAPALVIPFKRPVYEEVVRRFRCHAEGIKA